MNDSYIGEICLFAFGRAPVGWLVCDGRQLNISDQEVLFTLIGTAYGGDGARTFCLPDLRGRVPVHQGQGVGLSARPIGGMSGFETVSLQAVHAPPHSHALLVSSDAANQNSPKGNVLAASDANDKLYASPDGVKSLTLRSTKTMTTSSGGGKPHDNVMPTLPITYCICVAGIYPSRAD